MRYLLVGLITCTIIANSYCWRFFYNGRLNRRNLGVSHQSEESTENANNFTRWFTQQSDHFRSDNYHTWNQRYYVNDEYFDQSRRNVAFLLIGGEGEATADWMTRGQWVEYGKQFNAILFQLEHRFYGKSHPTDDLSDDNLIYLTSEQALSDIAYFVGAMNEQYKLAPDVKWIVFGGSYPGSLAAWARLKFPHLISGAVSTSGPLLAIPDFQAYFQVIADDLRTTDESCYAAVKEGTAQVELLLSHQVGLRTLSSLFKLCDPLEKSTNFEIDVSNFFSTLAGNFAGIAQYNKDNRLSTKGTMLGNITLNTICSIMTDTTAEKEITRLAIFNSLMLKATSQKCLDYNYAKMISEMSNPSWNSSLSEGGRQWMFQTCNEFGFFQTSGKKPQVFGDRFPLKFWTQQCNDIFGPKYTENFVNRATNNTNIAYGGLNIEVTNVVFVHGSVDPWHMLGITSTISDKAPAIFIKGTAHCANMYPASDDDPAQLKAARIQIGKYIQKWIIAD